MSICGEHVRCYVTSDVPVRMMRVFRIALSPAFGFGGLRAPRLDTRSPPPAPDGGLAVTVLLIMLSSQF